MKSHEHNHDIQVTKVDRLSGTKVRLTVELPGESVKEHEQATTRRYAQAAKIPGFRPGKAPVNIIRQRFADDIRKELVSHLLESCLSEAIEKTKLFPVNMPSIQMGSAWPLEEGKNFQFDAEFEIRPEFELKNYKGVPVKTKSTDVSDEELSKTLDTLRDRFSTLEPVTDEKPAAGQFASVEIGFQIPTKPERSQPKKVFTVELGGNQMLPELEKAFLEMSLGEERKVDAAYPADYPDKDLAGLPVEFECKLIELKKKVLPELNDALAEQIRPGSTIDSIQEEIRQEIRTQKEQDGQREQRREIVDYLIAQNNFEVPTSMVKEQAKTLISYMQQDLKRRGAAALDPKAEELKAVSERAEQMVRSSLILREVAEKEKIELDENRLQAKIDGLSVQWNRTSDETRKFLAGKEMLDQVKDEVLTDQVFDFLIKHGQMG